SSVRLLVDATLISTISVSIGINGHIVLPAKDTSLVYGDTYSYFSTVASQVQVNKYAISD
ncbi:hypothetical protein QSE28_000502, partial [Escherichia coli]